MGLTLAVMGVVLGVTCVTVVVARPSARWIVRHYRYAQQVRATVGSLGLLLVVSALFSILLPDGGEFSASVAAVTAIALGVSVLVASTLQRRPAMTLRPRRVLAIGAHPDDLELGCGASLVKLIDKGDEVRVLVMSRGGEGGEDEHRLQEAQRGGSYMGAASVTVLDFPDTRFAEEQKGLVSAIEQAIREFSPDIILTHSRNDYHQDHSAVHHATMRAARRERTILCYESPSATRHFSPVLFMDVAGYVTVKAAAIDVHADQREKAYMTGRRAYGAALFRGDQARLDFAEGFEVVRMDADSMGRI